MSANDETMTTKPLGVPVSICDESVSDMSGLYHTEPTGKAYTYAEVRELCRRAMQYNDTGPAIEDDWLEGFLKEEGIIE